MAANAMAANGVARFAMVVPEIDRWQGRDRASLAGVGEP
jgi:hypothetical protein